MYKTALKEGYQYKTTRGLISTEDLFILPLTGNNEFSLDAVAKTIAKDIKEEEEESFVSTNNVNSTNTNKLEIVKDIIADKLAKRAAKLAEKDKAEKKRKLLEILARKQDASLENKTETELLAELEALNA